MLDRIAADPGQAWLLGADAYLCTARAWRAAGEPALVRRALEPLLAATGPGHWAAVHEQAVDLVAGR